MISISKRRLASLISASAMVATLAVAAVPTAALAAAQLDDGAARPAAAYQRIRQKVTDMSELRRSSRRLRVDGIGDIVVWRRRGKWYDVRRLLRRRASHAARRLQQHVPDAKGYTTSSTPLDDPCDIGARRPRSLATKTKTVAISYRRVAKRLIFHVGSYRDDPGRFYVNASNNAPGDPRTGVDPFVPLAITESGWYTFKHEFKNDGGVLAVEMNVIASRWQSVATWTLRTETDAIGGELGEVGGNRYAWLVNNDFDGPRARQHHPGLRTKCTSATAARREAAGQPLASGRLSKPGSPRGGPGLLAFCP